jgi:hypothetical protein
MRPDRSTRAAPNKRRGKEQAMSTITLRYARYVLAALNSVGFALTQN